jgi:hypothetical protein
MPAKAPWMLLIPEIIAMLEVFDVPVIDRAVIERLFGLRRRRAIELLHRFGGYQAGQTFLVDRNRLIQQLRMIAEGEEFERESRRRERLDQNLDCLRRSRSGVKVKIPIEPEMLGRNVDGLSAGIGLSPGHLQIEFDSVEELLSKLYELSQAAATDFDRFRAAAEPVRCSEGLILGVTSSAIAEQSVVEKRVELGQSPGAKIFGVDLQHLRDAGEFGKFHAAAASLPERDAFR